MDTFAIVINYIGAVLISIAFLPQTWKIFKSKNTQGMSMVFVLIYHLGLILFIIYGAWTSNWALLGANAFGFIINQFLLILIYQNQNKQKQGKK